MHAALVSPHSPLLTRHSSLTVGLNKAYFPIHCGYEDTARGAGNDLTERHAFPPGSASALYFRTTLPKDARRCAALDPHVLGGDAETRHHARNSLARCGPGVDPGIGGASGRHLAFDLAGPGPG